MRGRWVALIILIVLMAGAAILARRYPLMDWVIHNEAWIRGRISENPFRAWSIGLGIYFVISLIPGTGGKAVVCGWLFGLWPAVAIVDVALTLAAAVTFSISRYWFRDTIRSRFAEQVRQIDRRFKKFGATNLLMLRTAHVPYTFINYVSGAMDIPFHTFLWTTFVGMLPGTIIFVFVGTQLPTLQELQEDGVWVLLDFKLFAALAATVALSVLAHLLVRWNERGSSGENATPGG